MLKNTIKFLVCSCIALVFATDLSAQHYHDKFPDGRYEDYTVLTSDARYLPRTFVGFRLTGNPFVLYDNAGKFLLKTEYAYVQVGLYSRVGADCIVPFIRRHPTGKSSKLAFGGSATGEPFVFNMHMVRIKNLVKTFSFGTHFGYNYMMFREDARVQVSFEKIILTLRIFAVMNLH